MRIFASRSSEGYYAPTTLCGKYKPNDMVIKLYEPIKNFLRNQNTMSTNYLPPTKDPKTGALYWDAFTECQFPKPETTKRSSRHSGLLSFCCHPTFLQEGPWYDWAIVDYGPQDHDQSEDGIYEFFPEGCVPAKVLAFVKNDVTCKVVTIVHPCEFQSPRQKEMGSVLLEHWKLSFTRGDEQPDDTKFDYILSTNLI